ncbi:hypothetical protein NDU88_002586 [Pleurodeles waltl]|uniref:Uncharacterized protein n=1 Tax=Pleurodeles waltl TaxID=8319 RepID=A0AAV7QD41_PLEWA|nr:hypothetical protein NDU88_002586 [Pleurodeles waltl]
MEERRSPRPANRTGDDRAGALPPATRRRQGAKPHSCGATSKRDGYFGPDVPGRPCGADAGRLGITQGSSVARIEPRHEQRGLVPAPKRREL